MYISDPQLGESFVQGHNAVTVSGLIQAINPPLLQDLALNPRVFFAGVGILIIPIMV